MLVLLHRRVQRVLQAGHALIGFAFDRRRGRFAQRLRQVGNQILTLLRELPAGLSQILERLPCCLTGTCDDILAATEHRLEVLARAFRTDAHLPRALRKRGQVGAAQALLQAALDRCTQIARLVRRADRPLHRGDRVLLYPRLRRIDTHPHLLRQVGELPTRVKLSAHVHCGQ